jgi:hypothetical protein
MPEPITTTNTIFTHTPEPVTVDFEVTKNTKGYNWTVKVNTVQDVEAGMKLLKDTCEKMRAVYGGEQEVTA